MTHRLSINRGRDNQVIVGSEGTPIQQCDMTATNGIVHAIDRVIPDSLPRGRQRHTRGGKWMRDIHNFFERHWDDIHVKFDWNLK